MIPDRNGNRNPDRAHFYLMLTENPRLLWTLAGAVGLVVFLVAFSVGWATDNSTRALAQAVPLAASPGAVEVTRPAAAQPLPALRPAPRRPRARRTTTTTTTTAAAAATAPAPERRPRPPRRPAPKPVTIVGTG
jgi:hypothetical protein